MGPAHLSSPHVIEDLDDPIKVKALRLSKQDGREWIIHDFSPQQSVQIVKGTEQYDRWVEVPQPLDFKVYIFNVTNVEEVQRGLIPKVEEIGPYIYSWVLFARRVNLRRLTASIVLPQSNAQEEQHQNQQRQRARFILLADDFPLQRRKVRTSEGRWSDRGVEHAHECE
jgi:CD36 family